MEAIALTLPVGGSGNNNSFLGGIGSTLSTNNYENSSNLRYDDYLIRELAFDLGVDPNSLKSKLQSVIQQHLSEKAAGDNSKVGGNLQFHL